MLLGGGLDDPWGDYQYYDGARAYTDAYGHYAAAYPDILGLEDYGQDLLEYGEDIPLVGGVYEGARRRGLAVPAIVGTIVLVILVVVFLRSSRGKKMIAGAKTKIKG